MTARLQIFMFFCMLLTFGFFFHHVSVFSNLRENHADRQTDTHTHTDTQTHTHTHTHLILTQTVFKGYQQTYLILMSGWTGGYPIPSSLPLSPRFPPPSPPLPSPFSPTSLPLSDFSLPMIKFCSYSRTKAYICK